MARCTHVLALCSPQCSPRRDNPFPRPFPISSGSRNRHTTSTGVRKRYHGSERKDSAKTEAFCAILGDQFFTRVAAITLRTRIVAGSACRLLGSVHDHNFVSVRGLFKDFLLCGNSDLDLREIPSQTHTVDLSVTPIGFPFTSKLVLRISFSKSARSLPRASRYPTSSKSQGILFVETTSFQYKSKSMDRLITVRSRVSLSMTISSTRC